MPLPVRGLGVALILLGVSFAAGQQGSIVVEGIISDPAGAPVDGATIVLAFQESDQEQAPSETVRSAPSGRFSIRTANVGPSVLTIKAEGFKAEPIKLNILARAQVIDLGTVKLKFDCSAQGANCDDFGLDFN